jgi:predicted PurR-regulated permease PerM
MSSDESGFFYHTEQGKPPRLSRVPLALIITAATVVILAGVQAASGLVGPILLALFIAVILLVPLRWLQHHGCPQLLAFLFVLICTITMFVALFYFVSRSLTDEIRKIPGYRDRFVEKYAEHAQQIEQQLEEWGVRIGELSSRVMPGRTDSLDESTPVEPTPVDPTPPDEPLVPVPPPVEVPPVIIKKIIRPASTPSTLSDTERSDDLDDQEGAETLETVQSEAQTPVNLIPSVPIEDVIDLVKEMEKKGPSLIALDTSVIAFWLARIMLYLQNMLGGAFLVLLFTIFMLFEASHLPAKVNRAFGKDGPLNIGHFHRIAEDIRRYLFLKTLANLMSGSAAMLVYYMFGVPAFFFWGIIAFFMYYIPNIGGTMAAVIPGALILMGPYGIPGVLLYALCLLAIECTIAYGIEPRILGHGLRLSTLVIILSLFFWGFLLGPIGLFLAAPLTVMTKIILQAFPETRWLAVFLDSGRDK